MSDSGSLDKGGTLGRALFGLVDASQRMSIEIRTRVVRVRNAIEAGPNDPMVAFKIEGDLGVLMRESRLNAPVRALRKALRRTQ